MREMYGTVEEDDILELGEDFYSLTFYGYYLGDLDQASEQIESVLEQHVDLSKSYKARKSKKNYK